MTRSIAPLYACTLIPSFFLSLVSNLWVGVSAYMTLVQTVENPKGLSWQICPRVVPRMLRHIITVLRVMWLPWWAQPQRKVWLLKGPPMSKFFQLNLRTFHCFFSSVFVVDKNGVDYAAQSYQYSGLPRTSLKGLNPDLKVPWHKIFSIGPALRLCLFIVLMCLHVWDGSCPASHAIFF